MICAEITRQSCKHHRMKSRKIIGTSSQKNMSSENFINCIHVSKNFVCILYLSNRFNYISMTFTNFLSVGSNPHCRQDPFQLKSYRAFNMLLYPQLFSFFGPLCIVYKRRSETKAHTGLPSQKSNAFEKKSNSQKLTTYAAIYPIQNLNV